jgi:hypothetical protein
MNFFQPLEAHVKIEQKVLKYTSVQKLEMFLVGVLAGAKAVSHMDIAVRLDPALISAFGLRRTVIHCGHAQRGHRAGRG